MNKSTCKECTHRKVCAIKHKVDGVFSGIITPVFPGPNKQWFELWSFVAGLCNNYELSVELKDNAGV